MFGLAAMSLLDWDPLFATQDEHRNDRRKFACSIRDLVEGCLLLCDHADNVGHFSCLSITSLDHIAEVL